MRRPIRVTSHAASGRVISAATVSWRAGMSGPAGAKEAKPLLADFIDTAGFTDAASR
jgi:hypothetical protein